MHGIFSFVIDTLFPPQCAACAMPAKTNFFPLCDTCSSSMLVFTSLFCPVCGNRLPTTTRTCHQEQYFLLGAATDFNGPNIQKLIHALKYDNKKYVSALFGKIMANYFLHISENYHLPLDAPVIIPMPTSKKHLRQRGYNQAQCIAEEFITHYTKKELQLSTRVLIKTRATKSQTECITVKERKENVRGSFSIINGEILNNKDVIIIDDVHTTGATLQEVSVLLKKYGARNILALVFAKT